VHEPLGKPEKRVDAGIDPPVESVRLPGAGACALARQRGELHRILEQRPWHRQLAQRARLHVHVRRAQPVISLQRDRLHEREQCPEPAPLAARERGERVEAHAIGWNRSRFQPARPGRLRVGADALYGDAGGAELPARELAQRPGIEERLRSPPQRIRHDVLASHQTRFAGSRGALANVPLVRSGAHPIADGAGGAERNGDGLHRCAERTLFGGAVHEPSPPRRRGELVARDGRERAGAPPHVGRADPRGPAHEDHRLHAGILRRGEGLSQVDDRSDFGLRQHRLPQGATPGEEHPGVRDEQRRGAAGPHQLECAKQERGVPIDLAPAQRGKLAEEERPLTGFLHVAIGRVGDEQVRALARGHAQRVRPAQAGLRATQAQGVPGHAQRLGVQVEAMQVAQARAGRRDQESAGARAGIEDTASGDSSLAQRDLDDPGCEVRRRVVETCVPAPGVPERARLLLLEMRDERVRAQERRVRYDRPRRRTSRNPIPGH